MNLNKLNSDDLKNASVNAGSMTVTTLAGLVHPSLAIAVGIAASYFGPAIERRQGRAKELIQYIQDNISVFTPEILSDESFQDGFVVLMEKYIRERNDDKRVILQKVFQGYIGAPDLLEYPLEEMTDLVSRIRMSDVAVLGRALTEEARNSKFSPSKDVVPYSGVGSFMLREDPNAVSRLVYLGLLHEDRAKNGPKITEYDEKNFLYVWVSPTGREFASYLNR